MLLLDHILNSMQEYEAHDFHLLSESEGFFKVVIRKNKKVVLQKKLASEEYHQLIDYLKFHSHYRYEQWDCFQNTQLMHHSFQLRLAFSPGLLPYVTCRWHQHISLFLTTQTNKLLDEWERQKGLILILGPVKAGKSTLYYEILKNHSKKYTLFSLEDPIEKNHPEFYQLAIDHMSHLESFCLSLLRFDLDLMGVGEIRNIQYLEPMMNLCLTGTLAITTMHAHSIHGFLKKLKNLSSEHFSLLKDILTGVIFLESLFSTPCVFFNHEIFN